MTSLPAEPVDKQYPLLYWITLAYMVGVPNFLHYDVTGRTHANGLFNVTSVSGILLTLLSGYCLVVTVLLSRRPFFERKVNFSAFLWIGLLLQLALASLLQPTSRLTPPAATDFILSFYRLCEWVLAVLAILILYARSTPENATRFVVKMIGRACWIWIGMVWCLLPIVPSQVYASSDENVQLVSQLGGQLIRPSTLATLAIIGFFYAFFFFPTGFRKWGGCTLAFVTLVMARTRTEQATFLVLILLYTIVYSRKPVLRLATGVSVIVMGVLGLIFRDSVVKYVARGQRAKSLTTLNDRTLVWKAALEAVHARPLMGYGFIAGAKNALKDHWIYQHWLPPHAHNELIQTLLAGGMIACSFVLCIYARAIWTAFRVASRGPEQLFLLLILVELAMISMFGSVISAAFGPPGAIFFLSFLGVVGGAGQTARSRKTQKRTTGDEYQVLTSA